MGFRARGVIPAKGYDQARVLSVQIADGCAAKSVQWLDGAGVDRLLAFMRQLDQRRNVLLELAQIPGIGEYAKEQEGDPNYDVAEEFTDLIVAMRAVTDAIATGLPISISGHIREKTVDPETHAIVYESYNGVQLAPLRLLLDAVAAEVV